MYKEKTITGLAAYKGAGKTTVCREIQKLAPHDSVILSFAETSQVEATYSMLHGIETKREIEEGAKGSVAIRRCKTLRFFYERKGTLTSVEKWKGKISGWILCSTASRGRKKNLSWR